MAKTLMDMLGGGTFATTTPNVTAPRPAPASQRPPAPGMPDNRRLGERMGWGDNPLYRGFTAMADSGVLDDLGYGLLNSTNLGEAMRVAGNRSLQMAPGRRDERNEQAMRKKYSDLISGWGPDYAEFASGIADGAIEPGEGYWKALDYKRALGKETEEDKRNRTNAVFLADPALRAAVASGQMDFASAYRMQTDGGGRGKLGQTVQWLQDDQGNYVPAQVSDNGSWLPSSLPDGLRPVSPQELASDRAGGTVDGKTAANARAAIPAAQQAVTQTMRAIDLLRNDVQGQEETFGKVGGIWPQQWSPEIPNTRRATFRVNLDQAQGQAFMQARQMLKGGGQITDYEGSRAEAAFARLSTVQDRESFLAALDDFEAAVNEGYRKLEMVSRGQMPPMMMGGEPGSAPAGGMPAGAQTATNPQTGETVVWNGQQWVPAQ